MEGFPDIYQQQRGNRRRTILIIVLFILFFMVLGYGVDLFYFGVDIFGITGEVSEGFPMMTCIALVCGVVGAFVGLESGAKAVLSSAHAYPLPENDPKFQVLRDVVDEMAIASGLPRPAIYIIPDIDPNAFATGRDPEHSYVAVTEGLLEKLNREELQGVIAHEMSHVKNYDIRTMTVVAALIGAIFLDSDYAQVRHIVVRHFGEAIDRVGQLGTVDAKTELQELCQQTHRTTPVYRVVREQGPDHARWFVVEVSLEGATLARGEGASKRSAEQEAAHRALHVLSAPAEAPPS